MTPSASLLKFFETKILTNLIGYKDLYLNGNKKQRILWSYMSYARSYSHEKRLLKDWLRNHKNIEFNIEANSIIFLSLSPYLSIPWKCCRQAFKLIYIIPQTIRETQQNRSSDSFYSKHVILRAATYNPTNTKQKKEKENRIQKERDILTWYCLHWETPEYREWLGKPPIFSAYYKTLIFWICWNP